MHSLSRREFLLGSAALAAGAAESLRTPAARADQPRTNRNSPNERLNVAVIGVNGQGRSHVNGYAGRHNCVVSHICDVDSAVIGRAMTDAERGQGFRPTYVQDIRRLLENRDIHCVSIATPNHWHSLAAIWAMQAGKDVYVEKPVSHNVSEGRRVVEVARRLNKICQAGTQIRSSPGIREAIQFVQSGRLGQVRVARGLCYKPRGSIGRTTEARPVPATIDYDLWCGPAPNVPLMRQRLHYDWHWFWDYGNGDLGNQGIHQMDVARWGLGKNELARSVRSVGGRFGYVDDGQTANTQIAVFDYGNAELIFEVRGLHTPGYRRNNSVSASVGNVFHCADGFLVCPNYTTAIAYSNDGQVIRRFEGPTDHFGNFIRAVRSRRREDLNGDILEGHLSSALCHLANLSYRLGEATPFNGRTQAFGSDHEASETMERMTQHLRDNEVPIDGQNYRLGRRLTVDPQTERFVGDEEANRLLTREYRRGFEVPARV